jgi:hypothetical protein
VIPRVLARVTGAAIVLVSCLAAPLTPAHAYDGSSHLTGVAS